MDSLTLKLILTPLLVGGATLAGRRWGPTISGWLVALPYTAGPIVFFLALSQGLAFGAATAVGVLAGVISPVAFALTYAWLAPRLGMPRTFAASCLVFLAVTLLLRPLPLWWPVVYPLVLAALALGVRWLPRPAPQAASVARPPSWEIPARMLVATSYVLLLTAIGPFIGAQLTGLLTTFPLFAGTLTIFAHQFQGAEAGISVLRGFLRGMFAFATFFAVLAAGLQSLGLAAAFGLALAVALLIQAVSLWRLRRPSAEA